MILPHQTLRYVIALLFLLVMGSSLCAQPSRKEYNNHTVLWNKIELTEIFNSKTWGVGFDVIHRRGSALTPLNPVERGLRTSARPWLHFQLGTQARFSFSPLSYHHTQSYVASDADLEVPNTYELRSSASFFHHMSLMQGRLMHTWRYRLEFRNRSLVGEQDFTSFFRLRLRYRFRYMLNAPDFYTQGVLYTANSVELGLNMGRPVVYNTFNQNRIYLGLGYRFLNSARIELRYVDRLRSRASGYQFDRARGLMISLTIDQLTYLGRRYTQPIKYAD